jgi:ribonuclease HII
MILGIDEVGRGAWAGPMVVGAVVLGDATIDGLTDSKKLTKRMRERLAVEIRQKAAGVGLGWVSARVIDEIGLSAALKLAARRAIADVSCAYDEIIIDGTIRLIDDDRVTLLKKADLLIPAVSAASIVAKVSRDTYMAGLDALFDGYSFASHVGYGTAAHLTAIQTQGVLALHRQSFAPIAAQLREKAVKSPPLPGIGAVAEHVAADYLVAIGHSIIDRNWKTARCEIDIVSQKGTVLYFTEVKYRRQANQGGGLAAITPKKRAQMVYAAEVYVASHGALKSDRRLSAIALVGETPAVQTYLESV